MLVILLYSSLIAISLRTIILISFQKKRHWQISFRINPILFIEIQRDFLQFSLLNACIGKTKPKALQVSRSAKNLLNISSDRDCSFGSENFRTSSYQGDEKLLMILILLPSSWMVKNFLLKGLDPFAFLSDKEHILSEARLIIERAEAAWLSLSSKGGILIPVEENQNHEIHAQAEKVENSKVKGGPLTRSKSRSVQQDVAHPHFQ